MVYKLSLLILSWNVRSCPELIRPVDTKVNVGLSTRWDNIVAIFSFLGANKNNRAKFYARHVGSGSLFCVRCVASFIILFLLPYLLCRTFRNVKFTDSVNIYFK